MKEIDQENLDTAISLGDAVCGELGICCQKRGRVIFQIYKQLEMGEGGWTGSCFYSNGE